MRELQGGIIGSSLFIIFLGISGLLTAVLHFISPITGERRCASLGRQHALYFLFFILPVTGGRSGACLHCKRESFCFGPSRNIVGILPRRRQHASGHTLSLLRGFVRCSVAVNIAIVGLSLYESGFSGVGNCMQVSICKPMLNSCCLFCCLFFVHCSNRRQLCSLSELTHHYVREIGLIRLSIRCPFYSLHTP